MFSDAHLYHRQEALTLGTVPMSVGECVTSCEARRIVVAVEITRTALSASELRREAVRAKDALHVLDGAGWHISKSPIVPDTLTLMPLPPYSPDLDPVEPLWQHLRRNTLANRVFDS